MSSCRKMPQIRKSYERFNVGAMMKARRQAKEEAAIGHKSVGGAKVQVTGHRSGHRLQVTGHRSGYRPQATGQVTGHRSQATGQVTGHPKNNRTLDKTVLD